MLIIAFMIHLTNSAGIQFPASLTVRLACELCMVTVSVSYLWGGWVLVWIRAALFLSTTTEEWDSKLFGNFTERFTCVCEIIEKQAEKHQLLVFNSCVQYVLPIYASCKVLTASDTKKSVWSKFFWHIHAFTLFSNSSFQKEIRNLYE